MDGPACCSAIIASSFTKLYKIDKYIKKNPSSHLDTFPKKENIVVKKIIF